MWPCVLKERWWEKRTGSSSLNFFQAGFKHVVVESSLPSADIEQCIFFQGYRTSDQAVAKGSYHLQLVRSDLDFPMWSAVQGACSSLAPCTTVIRILWQLLEPTAFLVHPVLALTVTSKQYALLHIMI